MVDEYDAFDEDTQAPPPDVDEGTDAAPVEAPEAAEPAAAGDAAPAAAPPDPKAIKKAEREAKARAKAKAKAAARARASRAAELKAGGKALHSVELDDRLRRGDAEVRPIDLRLKALLDTAIYVSLALVILVIVGHVGIGFSIAEPWLIILEAVIAAILLGAGFAFKAIHWRALRGSSGQKILEKWKADLQLTVVSILALFTVIFILVVEVLALLVFVGLYTPGEAGITFASQFILLAAVILLVQIMAFVVREYNLSSYQPHPRAVLASNILTPIGGFFMLFGAIVGTGVLQNAGVLESVRVHQAVYIVTVGIGLEFLAMRIRLRLPSVWSLFMAAVETSRKANEEMRIELQKRALRTYVVAIVFVALSMAAAGAMVTGTFAVPAGRLAVALTVFYVGMALIVVGLVVLRLMQRKHLNRKSALDVDDLSELVGQRRRSKQEIARIGIYIVSGFLALIFVSFSVLLFATSTEISEQVPVLDDNGEQIVKRGEPQFREEIRSVSEFDIPTTYATDFLLLGIVVVAGPYGYFYNSELKRIEAIDEKFPDFLRDLAESARAGMTLPRALVASSKGTYGALTPDIQQMAAQVEWGVEFGEALERFAERTKTPLIDRTVALVVEAQRAGGNVVDVLTAASDDAREIKQIVAERTEQMKMYNVVVFIAFFVFVTVVMILSAQFLPAFKEAVDAATAGGQPQNVGGIQLAPFDIQKFNDIFFHAAVIQAIGGSLVGGVMTKGSPVAGFNSMFIMMAAAWIAFRIVLGLMTGG